MDLDHRSRIDYRKTRPLGQRQLGPVPAAAPGLKAAATAVPERPLALHPETRALYPRYGRMELERMEWMPPGMDLDTLKFQFMMVALAGLGVLVASFGLWIGWLLALVPAWFFARAKRPFANPSPWRTK